MIPSNPGIADQVSPGEAMSELQLPNSGVSPSGEEAAWRAYDDWRRFGGNTRLDFTLKQRIQFALASIAFRTYVRCIADSLVVRVHDPCGIDGALRRGGANFIFSVWHNRLIGAIIYFERFHARARYSFRVAPLVSESFDGELIARCVRDCHGENVRGSSSQNAVAGLKRAIDELERGLNLSVTGDGPKGPRYEMKPGVIVAAKLSGKPIVPLVWSCSRTLQLRKSWDQLMVPLRHATVELSLGEPLHVAKDAGPRDIALARRELERRQNELTLEADRQTRITWQIPAPRANERLKARKPAEPPLPKRV
jgi:hypothetical protein